MTRFLAALASAMLNRLLGPAEYSVVDDGTGDRYPGQEVYALLTTRVDSSDTLLATGLRRREAGCVARRVQSSRELARG